MNSINRAVCICPNCGTEQEIWFRYGKAVPIDAAECTSCETIYSSSDFVIKLLELRSALTASSRLLPIKA